MRRIRAFTFTALILLTAPGHPAGAQDAMEPQEPFPGRFDALAYVRVQDIEHSLRASDVRRVEHGAPPPLVPYSARLVVLRTYPEIKLPRLLLEGLVAGTWLPEAETTGILLVAQSGREYVPAGTFPMHGYLPEQVVDGARKIEFPPGSGLLVPFDRVWDCLCSLHGLQSAPPPAAKLEEYRGLLLSNEVETSLAGLFFLLKAPGDNVDWDALGARLTPAGHGAAASLPMETVSILLAEYASAESARPALEMVLGLLSRDDMRAFRKGTAGACFRLALRASGTDQAQLLETLLTREWDGPGGQESLAGDFAAIEPVLLNLKGEQNDYLVARMLREPSRFPVLRKPPALGAFWKLLDARKHPALPDYLRSFLDQPSPSFLGLSLEPDELAYLVRLAKSIVNVRNDANQP